MPTATTTGIKEEIINKILGKPKLRNFVIESEYDYPLKYAGLDPDMIAEIEYVKSIRLHKKREFEALLKKALNEPTQMEELEELITDVKSIDPADFTICVDGKSYDFIAYMRDFKIPILKIEESISIAVKLLHGEKLILKDSINIHKRGEKDFSVSLGGLYAGHNTLVDSVRRPFRCKIYDDYFKSMYVHYLNDNGLIEFSEKILKDLKQVMTHVHYLQVAEAKALIENMNQSMAQYEQFPLFFRRISKDIAEKTKYVSELEVISDPNMPIIERLYNCQDYQQNKFAVVPGKGKSFVVAMHGIGAYEIRNGGIIEHLEEAGYGGSIILYEHMGFGLFESFLARENKIGAIIHNTGHDHESTFDEVLENSCVTKEQARDYYNIPHNKDGAHGSEYLLRKEVFLAKVKNFL